MVGIGRKFLMVAALCSIGATQAQAGSVIGTDKVADNWVEDQIRWSNGPPSYKFRWTVRVDKGAVILCGAGRWVSGNLRTQTKAVIKDMGFFVDDALYHKDMTFFATVRGSKLIGARANCISTGKAPPKKVKKGVMIRVLNPKRVFRD